MDGDATALASPSAGSFPDKRARSEYSIERALGDSTATATPLEKEVVVASWSRILSTGPGGEQQRSLSMWIRRLASWSGHPADPCEGAAAGRLCPPVRRLRGGGQREFVDSPRDLRSPDLRH